MSSVSVADEQRWLSSLGSGRSAAGGSVGRPAWMVMFLAIFFKKTRTSTSQLQPRIKGEMVAYPALSCSPSSLELEVPDSLSGWSDSTSPLVSAPSLVLVA
jgi:hypothetical protein